MGQTEYSLVESQLLDLEFLFPCHEFLVGRFCGQGHL